MKITQKLNFQNIYEWDHEVSYPWTDKKEYVLWALNNRELPNNKYVKIGKRNFKFTAWNTTFKVEYFWWEDGLYRVTNFSDNKMYYIKKWEEKTVWRQWEILIDKTDLEASKEHLKIKVDNNSNLILNDISKNWTFIWKAEENIEWNNTINCEKLTTKEINEFNITKKSKEAEYFYKKLEEYKPQYKVNLWNWKEMFISNKLECKWEKNKRVIWYINNWDKIELRLFYKSRSEWCWRSCPWLRNERIARYSKGEEIKDYQYETTTKLVPELQWIFDKLMNSSVPNDPIINEAYRFWPVFLIENMNKETKVDTLFSSTELTNYLIKKIWNPELLKYAKDERTIGLINRLKKYYTALKEKDKVLPSAWKIMHSENDWEKEPIPYEITKWIFDELVPSGLDYKKMKKVKGKSYKYEHIDIWTVNVNVYETTLNWKKVHIHFWSSEKNKPEKIWIDNITYADDEANSFWIYKNPINGAPLVAKPTEYYDQSPNFWMRRMEFKLSGWNMDIRDIYQDNPIIKKYKELEWII